MSSEKMESMLEKMLQVSRGKVPHKVPHSAKRLTREASTMSLKESYVLVAAIDFGTTYSGYAFSFTNKPDDIFMNKNWGESMGFQSYKTSTCVLTGPKNQMITFGLNAEEIYGQLMEENKKHKDYSLFRHFKMMLHNEHITRSSTLTATNGKKRPALEIFTMALKFLKDHLLDAIAKQIAGKPEAHMVRWVVTVPAIWSDEAKQFMREAAFQAGCIKSKNSRQLVIALEPEAASIYCRSLSIDKISVRGAHQTVEFEAGTQYIIVDAGGGTIDITTHEVLASGGVRELHVANGGSWGGTRVDENFINLLKNILGSEFVTYFQENFGHQWLTLMLAFERSKKALNAETGEIRLTLSWAICSEFNKFAGREMGLAVNEHSELGVAFRSGTLVINHATCMDLFRPVVTKVADHVRQLLQNRNLKNLSYLLLVGGFGECQILQEELKKVLLPRMAMIVPQEAQSAIIKGAVRYGQNPKIIESRFARKTYGIDIEPRYDPKKHKSSKQTKRGGVSYCEDIFLQFIDKGTPVDANSVITRTLRARTDDQQSMSMDIFCTHDENLSEVEYVDDSKFQRAGGLTVFMPDLKGGRGREVEVTFKFGGTEIQVSAKDKTSGEEANTDIDMLLG